MNKDKRIRKRTLIVLLLLLVLVLAIILLPDLMKKNLNPGVDNGQSQTMQDKPVHDDLGQDLIPEGEDANSQADLGFITYEGHKYSYNTDLVNILFLGIDENNGQGGSETLAGKGHADCILLITLNKATRKASILQIPRDTMTNVTLYGSDGSNYSTVLEQIATQFAYANGGRNSCWATQKVVSQLLYELPIDGYFAMKMSVIDDVNDVVGGVELTIPEDYTRIDPAFKKGTTIKLTGEQAYDYVHYRDDVDFSNNNRMQRQLDYVPAFLDTVKGNEALEGNYYNALEPFLDKYIYTDLKSEEIEELAKYDLVSSEATVLPGEGKKGEKYEEFYADSEKIQKFLIEMFYILEK